MVLADLLNQLLETLILSEPLPGIPSEQILNRAVVATEVMRRHGISLYAPARADVRISGGSARAPARTANRYLV